MWAKNNIDILTQLYDILNSPEYPFTKFEDIAKELLKNNEILIDTYQLPLFNNLDEADQPTPCGK